MKKIFSIVLLFSVFYAKSQAPSDTGSLRTLINTGVTANGQHQNTGQNLNNALNGIENLMNAPQQSADYLIQKVGVNYTAIPKVGSGLPGYSSTDAYTVIQSAITRLTIPGQCANCGGGKVVLMDTIYNLSNELVISGWTTSNSLYGGGPAPQLIIEGKSGTVQFIQNTAAKNAIVIKNSASIVMNNFSFTIGAASKSAILMDSTGADKRSCYGCILDNISVLSSSSNAPGVYLRNFHFCHFGYMNIEAFSQDALVLENASTAVNYGNSTFDNLILNGNTTNKSGLKICVNNPNPGGTSSSLSHLVFGNVQIFNGFWGIYTDNAAYCHFNKVDIEFTITKPIAFGMNNGSTLGCTVESGFLQSNQTVYTAITTGQHSASNHFSDIKITGGSTSIVPISDSANGIEPDAYTNISFDGADYSANIYVLNAANTDISYFTILPGITTHIMGGLLKNSVFKSAPTGGVVTDAAIAYSGGGGAGAGSRIRFGYGNSVGATSAIGGWYDGTLGALNVSLYDNGNNVIATFRNGSGAPGSNTAPSARWHIPSGSATAGTAPLKIDLGTLLTTPEAGAFENDGGHPYYTNNSAVRYLVPLMLGGGAVLDFPSTGASAVSDLTITVTGAALGDMVILGVPNASVTTTGQFTAWVSGANTIKVRFSPKATEDPASGTFTVAIIR